MLWGLGGFGFRKRLRGAYLEAQGGDLVSRLIGLSFLSIWFSELIIIAMLAKFH